MSENVRRLLLLGAVLLQAAPAQFLQQGNKLVGSNPAGSPSQGIAVALSADGNTALVGAYSDNLNIGGAYVYVRANGVWNQQGPKLVGSGAVGRPGQGFSVGLSADGNTAILGALGDNGNIGAAWVFVRANGIWTQQGPKLVGTGGVDPGGQGQSVAISADGNTVILGASADTIIPGGAIGAAWVFTRTNGVWTQQGNKLAGSGNTGTSAQGFSVALSGDGNTALVGGPADNGAVGSVWIFTRTNGVWSQQGNKLIGAGADGDSGQGCSVALSADGNTAAVGGCDDHQLIGATWIFTRTNGIWQQQGPKLAGSDAVSTSSQGTSVSLSGDGNTLIAGGNDDNGTPTTRIGAAWIYTRANGVWSQQGNKLVGSGGVGLNTDEGRSVALSADGYTAIVGGPGDQPVGAAWVFVSSPVHLSVSAPASVVAGTPFSFTVTALDANHSVVPGYKGIVHFSITDPSGDLPAESMLLNGVGTFTAVLRIANPSGAILTAGDTVNSLISGTSTPIQVQAAATSRFVFSAAPPTAISGVPFSFTITSYDRFGNLALANTAPVHFSSSDGSAILPADSLMLAGVGTFSAMLRTVGNQTITVAVAGNSSINGSSGPIAVTGSSVVTNLALGSQARQSSTYRFALNADASRAVDGNLDGNFYDGSVSTTDFESNNDWWETDLGFSAAINSIVIWNRTDCCGSQLSNYWVFVSDTPFLDSDTPATLRSRAGTFALLQTAAPNPSANLAVNTHGRYVRVQLGVQDYLSLAEVQIFGTPGSSLAAGLTPGHPATQSSTYPGSPSAAASSAIDGVIDGNFYDGSVTATNADPNAWWQVDLEAAGTVRSVVIWNRTDCCASRLNDYWVFVSNTPFLAADTPATLQNRAATFSSHQTVAPGPAATIAFGGTAGVPGRYVRVQLSSSSAEYLSLAEVQVFGIPGIPGPPPLNVALRKPATQSSTYGGFQTDGASAAVDGVTDGNFYNGSVTATDLEANPWWQVDLGVSTAVSSVTIYNRTDCCGSSLSDYWVFVSDTPFSASDTPATLQSRAATFAIHQAAAPAPSAAIPIGAQGRYVRVQLNSPNYLSLAEVQVFGQ